MIAAAVRRTPYEDAFADIPWTAGDAERTVAAMDAARVHPFPSTGDVFTDTRDPGRVLRVTRHDAAGVVVVSLWQDGRCMRTFRLPHDQVGRLVHVLVDALDAAGAAADC